MSRMIIEFADVLLSQFTITGHEQSLILCVTHEIQGQASY